MLLTGTKSQQKLPSNIQLSVTAWHQPSDLLRRFQVLVSPTRIFLAGPIESPLRVLYQLVHYTCGINSVRNTQPKDRT
uniref:Uncharacterized protein n=1 Tax=Anguilla anguilla TaxID=7936 RepID=A0A0E9PPM5_ANGAN